MAVAGARATAPSATTTTRSCKRCGWPVPSPRVGGKETTPDASGAVSWVVWREQMGIEPTADGTRPPLDLKSKDDTSLPPAPEVLFNYL
jgi:hypothetical protein